MTNGDPQQDYIEQAANRYSSLFELPSHSRVILTLGVLCVLGGFFTVFPFRQTFLGIVLGIGFFLIVVFSDFVVCSLLRSEPIYNQRRCNALSLFSSIVWFGLMFLGTVFGVFLGINVWLRLFLLGFCAVALLRLLVYSATLFRGYGMAFVAALFQPVLWVVFLYFTWPYVAGKPVGFSLFVFLLVSVPLIVVTIFLYIYLINRVGKKTLGVSSMLLLKSFLANWAEDINGPLENVLEKLGAEQQVDVSLLAFKAKNDVAKAVMVVPAFHPGPFKNVGSSLLPYRIQSALEQRLNCVVAVPHGLFGHEVDLASQTQNQKVLDAVLDSLDFEESAESASSFVRVQNGIANAGCQIFGDCAVLALTVAPETTEDLPKELGFLAIDEARKEGLSSAVVINAHNSIDGAFHLDEAMKSLRKATTESLEKAASTKRSSFKVGAAKIVPTEFSLEDGMGPGGISAIVTRVDGQTAAYITIDGNNMVSGLREKMLEALREVGVDDAEVFTTDTHAVSAVVLNRRGYHPVGEVMDHEKLIGHVKKVVSDALGKLEPVEASWRTISVANVKVIGSKQVEGLCALTDKASKQAAKSAVFLFPIITVVLIALLLMLL
jgi:putative membrane protein